MVVLVYSLVLYIIKGRKRIHQHMWHTFGISPIRIVLAGQFPGWYKYSGGAEKGLQT